MTVASDRKMHGVKITRHIFKFFFVLAISIVFIVYITKEDLRDQLGEKVKSVGGFGKKGGKTTVGKEAHSLKKVGTDDNTEISDQSTDNSKRFLTIQKSDNKEEKESKSKSRKKLTENDEVSSAEIENFHDYNNNEEDLKGSIDENEEIENIAKMKTKPKQTPSSRPVVHKGELKKRFPTAIIAGVKKCGTRALLSFLGRHPLVKSAGMEMHFFDKNETYAEGHEWYLEQMPESYENEITIEKTPGYYIRRYVPERIFKLSKSMKLIFIFREPVQRAVSDYAQAIANKKETRFEKTVLTKTKPKRVDEKASKVFIGLYAKHLLNWLQYFPKMQMHFVNGDEFIRNPVPGMIKVQKFLELPVLLDEKSFMYNKTKGFYCIRNNAEEEFKCLGESKGRRHPTVKKNTLQKLKEFYKPNNEKFFELIGQDFGWPTTKRDSKPETKDENVA